MPTRDAQYDKEYIKEGIASLNERKGEAQIVVPNSQKVNGMVKINK